MFKVTAQTQMYLFNQAYETYMEATSAAHDLVDHSQIEGGKAYVAVSGPNGVIWSYEINPAAKKEVPSC